MRRLVYGALSLVILAASAGVVSAADDFVASKNSDKFHTAACPLAGNIKADNKVTFKTAQDAIKAGYKPCQKCDPLAGEGFVASKNSDKYHKANCPMAAKISDDNMVKFKTAEDAAKAGYKPCQICLKEDKGKDAKEDTK